MSFLVDLLLEYNLVENPLKFFRYSIPKKKLSNACLVDISLERNVGDVSGGLFCRDFFSEIQWILV